MNIVRHIKILMHKYSGRYPVQTLILPALHNARRQGYWIGTASDVRICCFLSAVQVRKHPAADVPVPSLTKTVMYLIRLDYMMHPS